MTRIRFVWLLPLALAPLACSDGSPVDLGNRQAQLSDYADSWDGYAEAFTFPEGSSDRVRVTLDASGNGTIEIGEAPLDPTPTDPNVGLPGVAGRFHDGFRYPIHAAVVEAGRIRVEVDPGERFAAWCAIQTPYPFPESPGLFLCVDIPAGKAYTPRGFTAPGECAVWDATPAPAGGNILTNPTAVSCARYEPCIGQVCACTASACAYNPAQPRPDGYRVRVDGALDDNGASLVGTLAIHADWDNPNVATRVTVRLARQ